MRYLAVLALVCVSGVWALWHIESRRPITEKVIASLCASAIEPDERLERDLEEAIALINPMLDPMHRLFVLTDKTKGKAFAEPVPVYSGRGSVTGNMVVQVPARCPEVVFNAQAFYHGLKATLGTDVSDSNTQQMLAFLLLHEVGHIKNNHHGQFLPAGKKSNTNLSPTISKSLETEADDYVVEVIGDRIAGEKEDPQFTAHQLMNFIGYLSFVISSQNSIDCFGCRPLGSKDIFWDHSQSHENLELRLLKINHSIYPTTESKQLLDEFEFSRSNPGRTKVLYAEPGQEPPAVDSIEYGLGLELDLGPAPSLDDLMKEPESSRDTSNAIEEIH